MFENERLTAVVAGAEKVQVNLDAALTELSQWDGAKAVRAIDPNLVRRSRFANRHEVNFTGPEFEQLKAEIRDSGGNVQPIKVRSVKAPDGSEFFEIIYGHRRNESCRQNGLLVNALIDDLDDKALFVEMDRENRSRKDLSPWEQGVMYQKAIAEGLFASNRNLAQAVRVDLTSVGLAITLADLPGRVISAFSSPLDLQYKWAKPLREALAADTGAVMRIADQIAKLDKKPPPKEILARLTGTHVSKTVIPTITSVSTVVELAGEVVATIKISQDGDASVVFSTGSVQPEQLDALQRHLLSFLAKVTGS